MVSDSISCSEIVTSAISSHAVLFPTSSLRIVQVSSTDDVGVESEADII
jgi:hypothetical protein